MTVDEWEQELRSWDVRLLCIGKRRRPAWQEWLGKVGLEVGRTEALDDLVFKEDAEAVPVLAALLESGYSEVRGFAMEGLLRRREHEGVYLALVRALDDPDPDVRMDAEGAFRHADQETLESVGLTRVDDRLQRLKPDGTR
jgi:hypothetical protein